MLLEMIGRLISLDFGWFADLTMNGLMIGFMLLAVFYIFLEGKNVIKGSFVIFVTLFAFLAGSAVLFYYISKFVVLSIAENNIVLKKYLVFINELQFYASFVVAWI